MALPLWNSLLFLRWKGWDWGHPGSLQGTGVAAAPWPVKSTPGFISHPSLTQILGIFSTPDDKLPAFLLISCQGREMQHGQQFPAKTGINKFAGMGIIHGLTALNFGILADLSLFDVLLDHLHHNPRNSAVSCQDLSLFPLSRTSPTMTPRWSSTWMPRTGW